MSNIAELYETFGLVTIAQMSFLGTLALSVIFLKEKLSPLKITGMLCGIASIFLLTLFSK